MKKGCVDDGLAEPEFEISGTMFSVCFQIRDNNKTIAERSSDEKFIVPDGTISGTIKSDSNGERLLNALLDSPSATYDELAATLNMPRRTVSREIKKLLENGKIEREGARKNGAGLLRMK